MSEIRQGMGGDPEREQSNAYKPNAFSRRRILGTFLGAGATLGIEMTREKRSQTRNLDRVGDVLRGENEGEKSVLEIAGKEMNRKEFIKLVFNLIARKDLKPQHIEELLEGYSDMVEVEEQFGKGLNSLPALETIQPAVKKISLGKVNTATSYGYGQINPDSARAIALEYAEKLQTLGVLTAKEIAELKDPKTTKEKVVGILKLRGDENIIYGLLIFLDGYKHYGTDSREMLHANHLSDPRAFGLAVSAYSAKTESPRGAKIQTYLNEIMLADKNLETQVSQELGWENPRMLNVDGDLGEESLQIMELLSRSPEINIPVPAELHSKPKTKEAAELRMQAMHVWTGQMRQIWKKKKDSFLEKQGVLPIEANRNELAQLVTRRYSSVIRSYSILQDALGGSEWKLAKKQNKKIEKNLQQKKLDEIFKAFLENRDSGFGKLIASQEEFSKQFPELKYGDFVRNILVVTKASIEQDERYNGYIPTGYGKPRVPIVSNAKNVLLRVIMSHDLHPGDPTAIGLYPPRKHRQQTYATV